MSLCIPTDILLTDSAINHQIVPTFVSNHRLAYGSKAHLLNMFLYLLGLLPLTHLIVTLRPSMNTTGTGNHSITMVPVSFTEVRMTGILTIPGLLIIRSLCSSEPEVGNVLLSTPVIIT